MFCSSTLPVPAGIFMRRASGELAEQMLEYLSEGEDSNEI